MVRWTKGIAVFAGLAMFALFNSCQLLFSSNGGDNGSGNSKDPNSATVYDKTFVPEFKEFNRKGFNSKRGVCYNNLSTTQINLLKDGYVSWAYNWGKTPGNASIGKSGGLAYMPMFWGAPSDSDVAAVREYLNTNPSVKYLLGVNEPNMGTNEGGCYMLPSQVAEIWPKLETIAQDYNLYLVSPAMTYSGATLSDGKVYGNPEDWLNAFINEYKSRNGGREPRMDFIALHSYMAWPSAVLSYCNKYYKMYGKKILLTEFCAWWDEGQTIDELWQAEKLSQKIEAMDHDDAIEAYAWFKADGDVGKRPWNSLFESNKTSLSLCGLIYTYLSANDKDKAFAAGEGIPAVSYISSSNYNMSIGKDSSDANRYNTPLKFDFSNDPRSYQTIQLMMSKFTNGAFATYKIAPATEGKYSLIIRYLSDAEQTISVNGKNYTLKSTNGGWNSYSIPVQLKAGKQDLKISSSGKAKNVSIAWLCYKKD